MILPNSNRHFAGENTYGGGRVSTRIMTFDATALRGITSSGRVYELVGPPGLHGDGLYVWRRFATIAGVERSLNQSEEVYADNQPPA